MIQKLFSQGKEPRGAYLYLYKMLEAGPREGRRMMEETAADMAAGGLHMVLPLLPVEFKYEPSHIRRNRYAAWPEDPISVLTQIFHRQGLEVHAWVSVFMEEGPPEKKNARVLELHPDWAARDRRGQPKEEALDPASPAAQDFLIQTMLGVCRRYEVDGIALDYARYPGTGEMIGYDMAAIERYARERVAASADVCYCESCRNDFKAQFGKDSLKLTVGDPLVEKLYDLRRSHINGFMAKLRQSLRTFNPRLELSSYVWHAWAPRMVFQDWPTWMAEGSLDWINPTGYTQDEKLFTLLCDSMKKSARGNVPLLVTIGAHKLPKVEDVARHIEIARAKGINGFVFFAYDCVQPYLAALKQRCF